MYTDMAVENHEVSCVGSKRAADSSAEYSRPTKKTAVEPTGGWGGWGTIPSPELFHGLPPLDLYINLDAGIDMEGLHPHEKDKSFLLASIGL